MKSACLTVNTYSIKRLHFISTFRSIDLNILNTYRLKNGLLTYNKLYSKYMYCISLLLKIKAIRIMINDYIYQEKKSSSIFSSYIFYNLLLIIIKKKINKIY